jgi:2'-phosphotransferase
MRKSCQIFIYVDVQKALDEGVKFHLSDNGVILTEGDENGFLPVQFFSKVEDAKRVVLPGWEGK